MVSRTTAVLLATSKLQKTYGQSSEAAKVDTPNPPVYHRTMRLVAVPHEALGVKDSSLKHFDRFCFVSMGIKAI
jgi:hypothetical protein